MLSELNSSCPHYRSQDAIVAWRAWVLWGRNYRVIIPPITCILGGLSTYGTIEFEARKLIFVTF